MVVPPCQVSLGGSIQGYPPHPTPAPSHPTPTTIDGWNQNDAQVRFIAWIRIKFIFADAFYIVHLFLQLHFIMPLSVNPPSWVVPFFNFLCLKNVQFFSVGMIILSHNCLGVCSLLRSGFTLTEVIRKQSLGVRYKIFGLECKR